MLRRKVTFILKRFYSDNIIKSPYKEIAIPDVTIDQLIWENIHKWENKIAAECGKTGKRYTYKDLRRKTKCFASNLNSLGISGHTALMVLENCPEFPLTVLGCLEAGVTVSGTNPIYTPGEIRHQAKDSDAKIVITSPEYLEKVKSAELQIPIICTGREKLDGAHSFDAMTDSGASENTTKVEERLKQLALLPYSSGTTGLPKGVMLSHRNIVANLLQLTQPDVCAVIETHGNHQDTIPSVLPFFHIYGAVIVMLRGLRLGAKLVTLPSFDPSAFLNILRNNRDIVLHAVPPIISYLGVRPEVRAQDLDGLRHTMTAAAPCSAEDIRRLEEKKPHLITQGYGLTEASPALAFPPINIENKATVGYPVSNTLGKVIDPNTGQILPQGSHGEVCFKGPQVMVGYHKKPEATADTVKEDWLHTGDIGYIDEKGLFYIVDRIKELIKVKGFQVAPAELEALFRQHPAILDVGVTAAPSARDGELPIAFVVPKPGESISQDKLLNWISEHVAPYKKPAKIVQVSEIPKSSAGKILRRKLKDNAKDFKLD